MPYSVTLTMKSNLLHVSHGNIAVDEAMPITYRCTAWKMTSCTVICYTNKSEDTLLCWPLEYTTAYPSLSLNIHSSSWTTWLCSGKELEQIEK